MSPIFRQEAIKEIIGGETSCKSHPSNLELVLADPPNEGLVLQVVHCPPPQHLLCQAGVGHVGLSLVRLGQNGQQADGITGPQHCPLAKFELN